MPASDTVLLTIERGIAEVALNRPDKLNAMNDAMVDALMDAFAEAEAARARSSSAARAALFAAAETSPAPTRSMRMGRRSCATGSTR